MRFPRHRPITAPGAAASLESLEPRTLLFAWTAQEVYFAELVNRARANPTAEAARLGIDLTLGLTTAEQALLTPTFPLTLNAALTTAARAHSADMAARNFFDHMNPSGFNPTFRATAAGYTGTAGENIGAGYSTVDALYRSWMATPSERRNILSLYTNFDSTYHYDDLGVGLALNVPGALYSSYYTADFGNPTPSTRATQLSGVVFTDSSGDNFYTIGEGLAGIRIDAFTGTNTAVTPAGTYTTDAAGNYQFALPNGSYTVVFTRPTDNFRVVKTVTISGSNAKLDAKASELAPPPPPPDDHANAGQWTQATNVSIDPATGNGATTGSVGISGDTDLFTFTASKTGTTTLSALPVGGAFTSRLRVYNSSQTLLATGATGGTGSPASNSIASVSLTAGQTYYLLVDAGITGGTGNYLLLIQGPPPPPDDFAGTGQWSQAATIAIDPTTGSGTRTGNIESISDTDLFTFTTAAAPVPTDTQITVMVTGGSGILSRYRLYDASHALIGTVGGGQASMSVSTFTLGNSTTYFLLVDSTTAATGSYTLTLVPGLSPSADDYANENQWSDAAPVLPDSNGNAAIVGRLSSSDSDLFTFVPTRSGLTTLSAIASAGSLAYRLRIYDSEHTLIATGAAGDNGLDCFATASLTAGQRYYALIDSVSVSGFGIYDLHIAAPAAPAIPPQYLDASGQPVNPVYIGPKPTLAFINQAGQPVMAIRSAMGVWSLTDLQSATNSPGGATSLISWVEPRDGLLYAAAATPTGLILYKLAANNTWSFRNLTAEILVSRPIVSNLATFVDNAGLRQIGGLTAQGHLVSYWMTGLLWPQGWRYYYTNLATRDLTLRNHAQPVLASNFVTYVTQKNSLNYVTTNPAGQIILFFRPAGGLATQLWNWANLSQMTGAPAVVGNITATETSNRIVNISGTDASGNLWMITWRSGEGWRSRNVTAATTAGGSVPLATGSVTSWINSAGAGFVAGITDAGALVLYRYTFTANQHTWAFATLSAGIAGAPIASGTLRATTLSTGAILIAATTSAGEVLRYTFNPAGAGSWSAENVTGLLP